MKLDPLRPAVALLLVASAGLFVAGSRIERHSNAAPVSPSATTSAKASPTTAPAGAASRQSPPPAPTTDGGEGTAAHEAGEHAPKAATRPARTATATPQTTTIVGAEGSASREAAERAGATPSSERIFGMDVEQPGVVAAGAVIMLVLAGMAISWRHRRVLLTVVVLALAFAALDIREAIHQSSARRTSLVVVAVVLTAMHVAAALLAGVSLRREAAASR